MRILKDTLWFQFERGLFTRIILVNSVVWLGACAPLNALFVHTTGSVTPLSWFVIKPNRLFVDFQEAQPIAQFRVNPSGSVVVVKLDGESALRTTPKPAGTPMGRTADVEPEPATTTPVIADSRSARSTQRSRAHWILPILTCASVLAMLVIALVSQIQNKRHRRGI